MSIARMLANSGKLALPRITAPARRNNSTTVASRLARASTSANEPAVVCCASAVAMLSLIRIGMPSSEVSAHQLGGSGLAGGQLLVQVANRRILDAHHSLPSCPCLHVQHEKRESGNNQVSYPPQTHPFTDARGEQQRRSLTTAQLAAWPPIARLISP